MGPAPTTRTTRGAAAAANEAAAAKTTAGGDETTTPAASEEQKTEGGGGEGENEAGAAPPPDSLIRTENGLQYWSGIDADVNGMLGGFPSISAVDLRGSRAFLVKLGIGKSQGLQKVERALEGGAGIGRITKGLLLDISQTVDVVEPIAKFTETLRETPRVGQIYNMGHLTDTQLVSFLRRCRDILSSSSSPSAAIVVKENNTTTDADLFDDLDSSVTRTDDKFRALFREAGLRLVRTDLQNGLPKGLYPVRMYALKV
ncbi:Alpha N-terminal protein methyltransferase [Apiospora arundinis]